MGFQLAQWVATFAVGALKVVVGPLAGALAGATAAQGIAKRNAGIQRELEELRAANAAVSAAGSIVSMAAALKRQHVRSMKETYDQLSEARDAAATQPGGKPFVIQADLNALPPFRAALPMLEKLLYERINSSSGVLALFTLTAQSVFGVNDAIEQRNVVVNELKARSPIPDEEMAEIYFGLIDGKGHVDGRFRSTMEGLALHTDAIILYGYVLTGELSKHAEGLAMEKRWCSRQTTLRKGFPKPAPAGLSRVYKSGLIAALTKEDVAVFEALKIATPDLPIRAEE